MLVPSVGRATVPCPEHLTVFSRSRPDGRMLLVSTVDRRGRRGQSPHGPLPQASRLRGQLELNPDGRPWRFQNNPTPGVRGPRGFTHPRPASVSTAGGSEGRGSRSGGRGSAEASREEQSGGPSGREQVRLLGWGGRTCAERRTQEGGRPQSLRRWASGKVSLDHVGNVSREKKKRMRDGLA